MVRRTKDSLTLLSICVYNALDQCDKYLAIFIVIEKEFEIF